MKKLSVRLANATSRYVLPIVADKRIYRNDFSGFIVGDDEIVGCCCNCEERYCLTYSSYELNSDFFNSFPHNASRRVCPTDSISITEGYAEIDNSKCIGCGICIPRCPFSAFAFNANTGKCYVQNNKTKVSDTLSAQETQIERLRSLPAEMHYNNLSIPFINERSLRIINNTDSPEIIVRNYLVNLGITTNVNVQGNQHNRIEFFALVDETFLIGECETSNDVLSVSRRILDDLAVMVSRYSVNVDSIIPLAVINRLPNKRTDYYEVIEDIKKIIGVQVNTISYASLFFLNLFGCKISIEDFNDFIINRKSSDLGIIIQRFIPNFTEVCLYYNSEYFSVLK